MSKTKTQTQKHIQQILIFTILITQCHISFCLSKQPTTIYEILRSNGLPMGLLPKGVTNFSYDDSGRFEVYLDEACNSKFENEFHYDINVSGTLTFGQIDSVSGISAQDLFMWFMVKEIRVDIPSSGLIYFDVGVVHKQFSLSSFDTPRDCLACNGNQLVTQIVPKPQGNNFSLTFSNFDFFAIEFEKLSTDLSVFHKLESGL